MSENPLLDCVVRFHDVARLPELERCFFSLVGQRYRPLNIILVVQRFSEAEIEVTRNALTPLLTLPDAPTFEIHNWSREEPADARTFLLNLGIDAAKGRYLAFLDYDDTLYPKAYELLVNRLQQVKSAIVFASVDLMLVHVYQQFLYNEGYVTSPPFQGSSLWDLFQHNFCPLHSYLIDRERIDKSLLRFGVSLTVEEDYDLLLRICARYPSDFELLNCRIGCYCFKTDGSNTVATEKLSKEHMLNYEKVCSRIEQRRQSTCVSEDVLKSLGVDSSEKSLTIRQLLSIYRPVNGDDEEPPVGPRSGSLWKPRNLISSILCMMTAVQRKGGMRSSLKKALAVYRDQGVRGVHGRLRQILSDKKSRQL